MRRHERDGTAGNRRRQPSEPLTGECDHCSWHTVQDSYSAVVEAYQNHLREEHHSVWVRS